MIQLLHNLISAARSKIQLSIAMLILFEIPQLCSNEASDPQNRVRGAPTHRHHESGNVFLCQPNDSHWMLNVRGDFSGYLIVAAPVQYSRAVLDPAAMIM